MLFKLTIYNLFTFVITSSVLSSIANRPEGCSRISRNSYCLCTHKNYEKIEMVPKKNKEDMKTKTDVKNSVKKQTVKNKITKPRKTSKTGPTGKSTKRKMSRNSVSGKKVQISIGLQMTTTVVSTTKFTESDSLGFVKDMEPQIDMSQLKLKVDKNGYYVINVHVRRGCTNRVLDVGRKRLYIEIAAPEYEESFNAEISRFLSTLFRVRRRSVKLKRGVGSNIKKFVIPRTAILHNSTLRMMVAMLDLQRKKPAEC